MAQGGPTSLLVRKEGRHIRRYIVNFVFTTDKTFFQRFWSAGQPVIAGTQRARQRATKLAGERASEQASQPAGPASHTVLPGSWILDM